MDIKTILRENALLVVAFCIPLVIFFIVMTISTINKSIIRNPEYGLLFVDNYNAFDRYKPYNVLIEFGKLVIERNEPEPGETTPRDYSKTPAIFVFDHTTLQTRMLDINYNTVAADGTIVSPAIRELNETTTLITQRESPDGYVFSHRTGRAEGMIAGLFSTSFYHQGYALYKGGKIIEVTYRGQRLPDPQFLAWVNTSPENAATTTQITPGFTTVTPAPTQ